MPENTELTSRELEIALLIGDGLTNRAIAHKLKISLSTVKNHVSAAILKTGSQNRVNLAVKIREDQRSCKEVP
jgi:DNA-binding NarL/FixJ family response regulator